MASASAAASEPRPAVHLPPQLAAALGDQASSVAELCFLAPGVPYSAQLLDDMLADISSDGLVAECEAGGTRVCATVHRYEIDGTRTRPGKVGLTARVQGKRAADPTPIVREPCRSSPDQPADRAGLRAQLEWCRRASSDFIRRGFCDACYDLDPPAKRLRVGGSRECAQCVFSRSLQP